MWKNEKKESERMSEIKVGDMIKCRDSDDCVETMQVLSKEG